MPQTIEDMYREQLDKKLGYEKIESIKAEIKKREEDLRSWEAVRIFDYKGNDWVGHGDSVFDAGRSLRQAYIQFFKTELDKAKQTWYKHLRGYVRGAMKCGE